MGIVLDSRLGSLFGDYTDYTYYVRYLERDLNLELEQPP